MPPLGYCAEISLEDLEAELCLDLPLLSPFRLPLPVSSCKLLGAEAFFFVMFSKAPCRWGTCSQRVAADGSPFFFLHVCEVRVVGGACLCFAPAV